MGQIGLSTQRGLVSGQVIGKCAEEVNRFAVATLEYARVKPGERGHANTQ